MITAGSIFDFLYFFFRFEYSFSIDEDNDEVSANFDFNYICRNTVENNRRVPIVSPSTYIYIIDL